MLYILKILIMLGNDFSSANTSPNLNFASPSKTKKKYKAGVYPPARANRTCPDISSLSWLRVRKKGEEVSLLSTLFLLPNSIVRPVTPCHRERTK